MHFQKILVTVQFLERGIIFFLGMYFLSMVLNILRGFSGFQTAVIHFSPRFISNRENP